MCYLPGMSISRRRFFRGLVGKDEENELKRRMQAVEAYVRTHLLPYDFAVTGEQTAEALAAAVAAIEINADGEVPDDEQRCRIREVVEAKVERWRDDYLKAEEVRRAAIPLVREFLSIEATPEDIERLRQRFHIPYPAVLEEEIERQLLAWLGGLSNARLSACDSIAIRELVLPELRSWC
ncbi:MAG TPA: hypothetical protein VMT78_13485 [Terriglobia bacterium]|nr:hypothetical protein [Terriglobia bacterium]HVQ65545.1 hypothetical protein [Terriglobia bacterium]